MSSRVIVHVDMDAFFAAIEQRDFPELRGKPVVVGADPKEGRGRGVVSTCSYEARVFGIHSAQPISRAYRACPHAEFVKPRYEIYSRDSRIVMDVLAEFSPLMQPVSIDEAFLDCTGTEGLFGSPRELGNRIKTAIKDAVNLTASVGIAPNKFIAKVASDLEKPNGLTICEPGREKEFLGPLPIKRLWGAGAKTVEKLNSMGFLRIADVAGADLSVLEKALGKWGSGLWRLANGMDDRPVEDGRRRKSISEEHTYESDVDDVDRMEKTLFEIAERLSRNMRRLNIKGRTVTLKIRLEGFETFTRSRTLPDFFNDMKTLRQEVLREFRAFDRRGKRVRLLGIGMAKLDENEVTKPTQLELFASEPDNRDETARKAELLLDDLKKKFGDSVNRASLMGSKEHRWGPNSNLNDGSRES